MIYDKALAVASLRPYKAWSWAGEDYSNFIWQDSGTAPTEDEINAELTRLTLSLIHISEPTRPY